jgi:hypothetical protein
MEWCIEIGDHLIPFNFTLSDLIEFLFHIRREIVIHDRLEMFSKKIRDHHTDICREEFLLFRSGILLFRVFGYISIFQD